MRLLPRALLVVVLGALALGIAASPAAAHAVLESADPPDGARLDAPPAQVSLTFSEAISADLGGLRVFDTSGERVDTGAATVSGSSVSVGLRADLGDGAYISTYRVLSADGHPVRGALTFTVGDAAPASGDVVAGLLGEGDDRPWEIAGAGPRLVCDETCCHDSVNAGAMMAANRSYAGG